MTITVVVDACQLPDSVQQGAKTILDDPVDVMKGWSGVAQRNRKNTKRPRMFQIGYGVNSPADRQKITDLWMTNGKLVGFLFKDYSDHSLVNQNIGTGNGTNRSFLLKKTYTNDAARTYDQRITRPVAGTIAVTVAGTPNVLWTLNPLGEILFNVGAAPAAAAAVVVTAAEFLRPVGYTGQLSMQIDTELRIKVPTAALEEWFEV